MRIQFSSTVWDDPNVRKHARTGDLNIVWCLEEMRRENSAVWEQARAAARLGTICHDLPFYISNRCRLLWSPETKVVRSVHIDVLAKTGLAIGFATLVGTNLPILGLLREIVRVISSGILSIRA